MTELYQGIMEYLLFVKGYMPGLLYSCIVVIELTLLTVLLSWLCGLVAALGKVSKNKIFFNLCSFYVWFIRGTPTLIQVYIVYFGFPQLGIQVSPFVGGVLALGVNSGAYVAEIIRSGLLAIPKGQMESARVLGMNYFTAMRRIILPQVVRIILPPITNEAITMLKNTSLLSTITVMELTLKAQVIIAKTFRPIEFYVIAAFLYLILTTVLSHYSNKLEKRYALSL